ncbi:MAG: DAK2 domain-containing protein, partial [Proteocatella sp.]
MDKIDGKLLREMIISGANKLTNDKSIIDRLNVFPVPDGDTGTNMSLTIASAITELNKLEENDITKIGKSIAKGSLMGARGNSGVILSQILRGFAKSIEGKETLEVKDVALALKESSDVAYKAVMKPVEGTILTVIRETASHAMAIRKDDISMDVFFESILEEAKGSLNRTPELLKALKDANVVDSGGKGLLSLMEGMYLRYHGQMVEAKQANSVDFEEFIENDLHIFEGEIEFGYCTELMLINADVEPEELRSKIEGLGDSMVVVGDEGIIKIHIHTNEPGKILEIAGKHGQLDKMKIENMRLQQEQLLSERKTEPKSYGIISVAMGSGIGHIMKDFGVDHIIEGGQTMNPSTQDFINAINKINSQNIIILPNNSNIILAANQAKELSEKNIEVVETKTVPQAIAALMVFEPQAEFKSNVENMKDAVKDVKSGQVTYAVRDTNADGIDIVKDDIIGIGEGKILTCKKTVEEATVDLLSKMVDMDDIITLYYGEDVTKEEANRLK